MSIETLERPDITPPQSAVEVIDETPAPTAETIEHLGSDVLAFSGADMPNETPKTEKEKQETIAEARVAALVTPIDIRGWQDNYPDTPYRPGNPSTLAEHFAHLRVDTTLAEAAMQQAEVMLPFTRVASRFPLSRLGSVVKDGRLKSVHETRTSTGHGWGGEDQYITMRREFEAAKFGQTESDPPIIYGFLDDTLSGISDSANLAVFGGVELIFRPEVAKRSTFSEGDSLRAGEDAGALSFEDAVLAKQVYDTQFQKDGIPSLGLYQNVGIEAQIFGGASLEDVEMATLFMNRRDVAEHIAELEALHERYPDMKLVINLDMTTDKGLPYQAMLDHPYIDFVPVIVGEYVQKSDRWAPELGSGRLEARARYDKAVARKNELQTNLDNWETRHPEKEKPANLADPKLIIIHNGDRPGRG